MSTSPGETRMNIGRLLGLACEPLFSTITKNYNCSSYDWFFEKAVQQIRPDVLIIVNRFVVILFISNTDLRHVQSFFIANGTGPFNDFHFKVRISIFPAN